MGQPIRKMATAAQQVIIRKDEICFVSNKSGIKNYEKAVMHHFLAVRYLREANRERLAGNHELASEHIDQAQAHKAYCNEFLFKM